MALPNHLKRKIGSTAPAVVFEIEKGQIRRFASAIGETNPVHHDEASAQSAGFASLVAPVGFPAALDATRALYETLGLHARTPMHAEEEYEYFREICAGDVLTVQHEVTDIYQSESPRGVLTFYVIQTRAADRQAEQVFKGRRVLVTLDAAEARR